MLACCGICVRVRVLRVGGNGEGEGDLVRHALGVCFSGEGNTFFETPSGFVFRLDVRLYGED